jgi:hypothetical protein
MSIKGDVIAVGLAGAVLLAAAWYAKKKIAAVAPYLNPADERNVVNQAALGFYQSMTGSTGTIGGDFYDATHGGKLDGALTPTSENNIAARSVNWFGSLATDEANFSLGSKIYDWTH